MRQYHKIEGIPYDTSQEDELLMQLKGKNVDWKAAEMKYPNFDWGYIWERLGIQ